MSTQPEALRLAEWLDRFSASSDQVRDIAAELRRQHAQIEALTAENTALKRVPLTDGRVDELACEMVKGQKSVNWLVRATEAAHGITAEAAPQAAQPVALSDVQAMNGCEPPLEEQLKKAYYYTESGQWRAADTDEFQRWHAVAKVAIRAAIGQAQGDEALRDAKNGGSNA
ncbi:hypothetical protein IP84_16860 [beta proteobacterium AAP99]|nr:hypothetical protein IP84_16860 [beta proteobacterium AAP99]